MVNNCYIRNCNKQFDKEDDLSFYSVPSYPSIRRKWLQKIGCLEDVEKIDLIKICSRHFKKSDYLESHKGIAVLKKNSVPSLYLPSEKFVDIDNKKKVRGPKKNIKSVLSNNSEIPDIPKRKRGRPKKCVETNVTKNIQDESKDKQEDLTNKFQTNNSVIEKDETIIILESDEDETEPSKVKCKYISLIKIEEESKQGIEDHVINLNERNQIEIISNYKNVMTQTDNYFQIKSKMNEQNMIDRRFMYFTGFSKKRFDVLIECLQIKSTQFDEYLSVRDQLTLTLIKYRHSLEIIMLSELYGIRSKIVFQVFLYWTKELFKYFSSIDIWDLKHKPDYKYTAIINCFELQTEPSKISEEKNKELYCKDKNTFLLKYLLAVDEKNFVIFCSQVYGGSQNDRSLIMDSSFLSKFSDGDFILTDRDYDISDLWATRNITVDICDSEKILNPLDISEIESSNQYFVEQMKNLTKKQKILSETIPNYLLPIINEIVFNVNMLCNFNNTNLEC